MNFSVSMTSLIAALMLCLGHACRADNAAPSFNRDIKPILSTNCYACHGPDDHSRKAKLRLDTHTGATADLGGYQAIVPGNPTDSELILRVTTDDKKEHMPPRKTGKNLTADQIELLKRWIAQGAIYEEHWSFTAPKRPAVPAVSIKKWPRNAIDYFILARLEKEKLAPSPEADRLTLIRRVYLDLIGLPPTPEQADAFVADKSPNAYEKVVDELLRSKHYGERWARPWLDLARYADTNGYEKDRPRSIWPYRDWVINAINADMPYDQFSIEQLAGDMLSNATANQRIATGFHRNTMLNEEGGIDPLEYRYYAMVDRVATTGSVWLGLTFGCAQCHTHKYDPITHTDYYRLMALLNNADEPDFQVPDEAIAHKRHLLDQQIAQLEAALPSKFPPLPGDGPVKARRDKHFSQAFEQWVTAQQKHATRWKLIRPKELSSNSPKLEVQNDGSIFSSGDITKRDLFTLNIELNGSDLPVTALRLEVMPDDRLPDLGPGRAYYEGRKGDFFLSEVNATIDGKKAVFSSGSHSFGKISIGSGNANASNVFDGNGSTGWATAGREGEAHQLVLNLAMPITNAGDLTIEMLFERHFAASLGRFRWSITSATQAPKASQLPTASEATLALPRQSWTDEQNETVKHQFVQSTPQLAKSRKQIEALRKQRPNYPTTMVFLERAKDNPRPTYRHHRGEYLSPKEAVAAALPSLFENKGQQQPADRLSFARWLVSEHNPLAARVAVNRAWQAIFGTGIVATPGDFGTQGALPSHQNLLDWLAVEFMEKNWSRKQLHRLIVTSATYRQSSHITTELLRRDSTNRLLARGPRFRMPAEMIRDAALTSSGLLSTRFGGPSVFPPQPANVTALAYGGFKWNTSTGENRYRRSLYTFSKRTAPFAAYTVFNGPTGETCTVRRDRSNTPLQAMALLNDEMFIEYARALAQRVMKLDDNEDRTGFLMRLVLTRRPTKQERKLIDTYRTQQIKRIESGAINPMTIAGEKGASAVLAAWILTARVMLNLDEAITKQ